MKTFICEWWYNDSCSCHPEWEQINLIINAVDQHEALGLALEHDDRSSAKDWAITELNTNTDESKIIYESRMT